MTLQLSYERCVRTRNEAVGCTACIDNCPKEALALHEGSVRVELTRCIGCDLCHSVCPTEAIGTGSDLVAVLKSFGEASVRCGGALGCLGALSVEEWLRAALEAPIRVDTGSCEGCDIAATALPLIRARLEEANRLLEALGATAIGESLHVPSPQSVDPEGRRAFLRWLAPEKLLEGSLKLGRIWEKMGESVVEIDFSRLRYGVMRESFPPPRRAALLAALKGRRAESPQTVSFLSRKTIDPMLCDDCGFCYRLCPTGAIHTTKWHEEIRFQAALCVVCGACHDMCASKALGAPQEAFLGDLLEPAVHVLVRQRIKRCSECGALYKYTGGEALCPKCDGMDAEARELLGM